MLKRLATGSRVKWDDELDRMPVALQVMVALMFPCLALFVSFAVAVVKEGLSADEIRQHTNYCEKQGGTPELINFPESTYRVRRVECHKADAP